MAEEEQDIIIAIPARLLDLVKKVAPGAQVIRNPLVADGLHQLKTHFIIRKFADDQAHQQDQPYEVSEFEGNIGLNEGIQEAWDLICSLGTPTAFSNANAQTGVGDSAAAEAATQTDLQAAVNKTYKAMDATFPSRSAQTVSFRSTYAGADANYAWAEFIVRNGAVDLMDIIRKVSAQGTKTSGQTWELTVQITMS